MTTFAYAAYGSNLHPARLKANDRCPSAELRGTCTIPGWRLAFSKGGRDGSAKCSAERTDSPSDELRIALFDILRYEEEALDAAEGLGHGYHEDTFDVTLAGQRVPAKIYLADADATVTDVPYDWYKQMVLLGAQYHCFPAPYLRTIQGVPSKADKNPHRAARKWAEVETMRDANRMLEARAAHSAPMIGQVSAYKE